MALSKIAATIMDVTRSTDTGADLAQFRIRYVVTGAVSGQTLGELFLEGDCTLNDTQLTTALRGAVAAAVEPLVFPPQGFAAADVRGLNL